MFKEKFIKLCNEKNVAPSTVCSKIGLSNSAFSQWDKNSIPRQTTLIKIAEYFGVTVDELLDNENTANINGNYNAVNNSSVTIGDASIALSEQEQEILRIYNTLSTKEKAELLLKIYEYEKKGNE